MTTSDVLAQLEHLSNPERLVVIETATRLIRDDLSRSDPFCVREERNRRLSAAAAGAKDLYQPGGELTEWTALDAEEFLDDDRSS